MDTDAELPSLIISNPSSGTCLLLCFMAVIIIVSIQITSKGLRYNEGLCLSFCFGLEFPDEILIVAVSEEKALAVNWKTGTCGSRGIEVWVCIWEKGREREGGKKERRKAGRILYVYDCQQLFSNCLCWSVCMLDFVEAFSYLCVSKLTVGICVCACVFSFESFGSSRQGNSIPGVTHQSASLIPGLDMPAVCDWACVWVCNAYTILFLFLLKNFIVNSAGWLANMNCAMHYMIWWRHVLMY